MERYCFKRTERCELMADVHPASRKRTRGALLWIHGGGLITGHRGWLDAATLQLFTGVGLTLISIDHRLAPGTKLSEIVQDVEDAYHWARGRSAELWGIDADRIGVGGVSAGGYLALMVGTRCEPPPRVVVSTAGYGRLCEAWYSEPSSYYLDNFERLSRTNAEAVLASVECSEDGKGERNPFYIYCRQQGSWPQDVSGWDPATQRAEFVPYEPIYHVSPNHPPTLLVHGTADYDVPYRESTLLAEALLSAGVEHALVTIEGAGHVLEGVSDESIAEARVRMANFLERFYA